MQLWNLIKLECNGSPKQLLRLGNVLNKLVTLPWKEGTQSFSEYLAVLIDTIMIIESILNVKFPEVMLVVLSIRGLPSRYEQLITSIMNSSNEMTIDILRLRIAEFLQAHPYTVASNKSINNPLLAMNVTSGCFRCGLSDHEIANCKTTREDATGKCSICNGLGRYNAHLDAAHGMKSHKDRRKSGNKNTSDKKPAETSKSESNAVTGDLSEIQAQFID